MSAKWTFAVYMAGNNSLSDAAGVDLEELRRVGSSDTVKVCVFVKQADGSGARRFVVGRNGAGEQVEELGDIDSGDPQTVVDFYRWVIATAPAQRYAFVLWNHGGGWRPGDLEQLFTDVRGEDAVSVRNTLSELNARASQPGVARAVFTPTLKEIVGRASRREREILTDDGTRHSLDTIELGNVCAKLREELGQPIDLLGMDACLMSTIEVAYQVRADVTHIVGSEREEPGAGWPYELVLADLAADPDVDGAGLGEIVVRRYIESYRGQSGLWPVTQSAVSTDQAEAVATAINGLAQQLRTSIAQDWPQLLTAQAKAVGFTFDLVDLATLASALQAGGSSAEAKEAAKAVADVLSGDGYVIAEDHLGDEVEGCRGVSVYLPAPPAPVSPYYAKLAFADASNWDELLDDYSASVRGGS
jgi:Clostripain family